MDELVYNLIMFCFYEAEYQGRIKINSFGISFSLFSFFVAFFSKKSLMKEICQEGKAQSEKLEARLEHKAGSNS